MRVEIPYVVLNKKGRPVEGATISVFKRTDYEANANLYPINTAVGSGTTYTYYTDFPHDLEAGDTVTITGCANSIFNVVSATIATIPTTSSFTVVGGTSFTGSSTVNDGQAAKTPISPVPLYTTATGNTQIFNPVTDSFGRIEGWVEEGQYAVLIDGLNLTAVQYFEAVSANVETGSFTRAGVTLQPGSIKFGDNPIITATTGGDVQFEGNTDTSGYSTYFTSYPFTIDPADYSGNYYGSNLNRNDISLSMQNLVSIGGSSLSNLPASGSIRITPTQTYSLSSATRTFNSSTNLYDYTFTTAADHSMTVGSVVTISGAANLSYNGEFGITEVGSRTTFKVPGAPTDPGSNAGFTNGLVTCESQVYEINYFTKDSPIIVGASGATGMTISSGSLNTISGVPISGSVPYVGQGITITNYSTGAAIVGENTTTVKSITQTSSNVYTIVMSANASTAVSSSTSLTLSFAEGIRFTDIVNTATTTFAGTSGNAYLVGSSNASLAGIGKGMGVTGANNTTDAAIPRNAVVDYVRQTLTSTATGGNYTLSFVSPGGTTTTSNIAYNASASTVQSSIISGTDLDTGEVTVALATYPAWSVSTEYATNDVVTQSGSTYIALQPTTGQNPTTTPASWKLCTVFDISLSRNTGGYLTVTASGLTGGSASFGGPRVYITKSLTANVSASNLEFGHVFAINNDVAGTWNKKRANLPKFTSSSSNTATSMYGLKNIGLALENGASVEKLRTALNYVIEDLKKYGLIS